MTWGSSRSRVSIRWQWTGYIILGLIITQFTQFQLTLNIERNSWLKNHVQHENLIVHRLAEELELAILSSVPEVEYVIDRFLEDFPDANGVYIHNYAAGEDHSFGKIDLQKSNVHEQLHNKIRNWKGPDSVHREWYIERIMYADKLVGHVIVYFNDQRWEEAQNAMIARTLTISILVLILSGLIAFGLIKRVSKPFKMLSDATKQLVKGNHMVRLQTDRNDEIGDAFDQYNSLAEALDHKERLRHSLGRYLNPEVVSNVFETGEVSETSHRKHVTALFADMVGFTNYSHSAPTEEVVNVLNRYFETFHRIINYYGGHVDKYIGDALLATFNHPDDDPDHAFHASLAGIAITMATERIGMLNAEGKKISFRVGLNQGPVIIGNIGAVDRLEYTVIGDAVNVASRIAGKGNGDELIMSHSCYAKINNPALQFISHGKHEIKGVTQTIQCGSVYVFDEKITQELEYVIEMAINPKEA